MKDFLAGWRTRIVAALAFLLGIVGVLDPAVVTSALGLGSRGHSMVLIGFAIAMFILRQMSTAPPAPLLPTKK